MLTVAVHEYKDFSASYSYAAFYSRPVADVVRMTVNNSTGIFRDFTCLIR
jgi:hypothetical protein